MTMGFFIYLFSILNQYILVKSDQWSVSEEVKCKKRMLSQGNGLLPVQKNQSRAKLLIAKQGEIDCMTVFSYELVRHFSFLLVQMNKVDLSILLWWCLCRSDY